MKIQLVTKAWFAWSKAQWPALRTMEAVLSASLTTEPEQIQLPPFIVNSTRPVAL
jgi:hypothetical protein